MNNQINKTTVNIEDISPLLQVFDMPTSLNFYRDILGFEIDQSSGEGDDVYAKPVFHTIGW